jgi:replicative DNA helicase
MPQVWDARTLADSFVLDQKNRHQDPDKYRGYYFPMDWWMEKTGGIQKGWVAYIMGQAGIGKSSILSTAAVQNGKDGVPFVYFSLEESVWTTAQRIFANLAHINRIKFRDIKLDQTDFQNLYVAANEFGVFDAYFVDDAWTDTEITECLKWIDDERTKANLSPLEVVYADYLQLTMMSGASTQVDNVAQASKFFTRIAKGQVTPNRKASIVAVQLNADNEPLWSKDPNRDGDVNIEIAGIDDGFKEILPDKRKLRVRKNRHGDIGATTCAFIGSRSLIGQLQDPVAVGKMQPPKP